MMNFNEAAEAVMDGAALSPETLLAFLKTPDDQVVDLLAGANRIRARFFGHTVHLCSICNAKSGRCSENCGFCAQSAHHACAVSQYPLQERDRLRAGAVEAAAQGVNRYSLVTSGKGLSDPEVDAVAEAIRSMNGLGIGACCSLGILSEAQLRRLKEAGVTRYHHNLETAESFFDQVCTTHTYADRVATVRAARAAGMGICSGGIFGLGESDEQIVELGLALKELGADCVPVNFHIPVPGTRLDDRPLLAPLKCLKIIAVYRYILRDRDLLVGGGRAESLRELQSWIFLAGASAMLTGNYLTTTGRTVAEDLRWIGDLGMTIRS